MKVDKTYEADKVRREPACSTRPCWTADQEAAPERTDAIRLKIVLMLAETPGSKAPAATAMKPARSATPPGPDHDPLAAAEKAERILYPSPSSLDLSSEPETV